uniref:Putative secreted protein n=1 Tax=Anopheles marajoara TaxID=58244 RepID=A0A2M4C7S8_9DIPT
MKSACRLRAAIHRAISLLLFSVLPASPVKASTPNGIVCVRVCVCMWAVNPINPAFEFERQINSDQLNRGFLGDACTAHRFEGLFDQSIDGDHVIPFGEPETTCRLATVH